MQALKPESRTRLFLAAALLLVALLSLISLRKDLFTSHAVSFKETGSLLVLANDSYEIGFQRATGGIAYIKDMGTGSKVMQGNRKGALWWAFLKDNSSINSLGAAKFDYEWKSGRSELLLHYGGKLAVDVTASFDESNRIALRAEVQNGTNDILQSFRFPYELKFAADSVVDGLLPMLPGVKLKPSFFTDNNAYEGQYPGVMFASYTALRTTGGNVALYDLSAEGDKAVVTTELGFKNQTDDAGKSAFVHQYNVWTESGASWQSPTVVLEIGGDYMDSIVSYRKLGGIDRFPSLDHKLGSAKAHTAELPLMKLDISALGTEKWDTLTSAYVDALPYNGMLHLVGFQTGGHDENYPDFLPADPKWGGEDALQAFIADAKAKGNQVVPYTNFSWWGVHSPTLAALPEGVKLEDIVVEQANGTLLKEDYGEHSGYVMNLNHPFVTKRIAEEHQKLIDAGVDGIFEDQWGIRSAPFVAGEQHPENTDAWSAYFEGVQQYFASSKHRMYTEDGIDVLADNSIGFLGTNYLWDLLGYRKNTASYTDYYPLAGMLLRDKVLLYQHDLAAETMTDNKDMLRWNAAMGYNLSGDLYTGTTNPWVSLIGVFQKYVLADYADALVQRYDLIDATTTRTDFGTHIVTANWDTQKPYTMDEQTTLTAGGFDIASVSKEVRAGSYARYNGYELDPGEHYLAEIREKKEIRVYQPIGSDTTLRIKPMKGWKHAHAAAYEADGKKIADIPVAEAGEWLMVDFIADMGGKMAAYVSITPTDDASPVKESPFKKVRVQENLVQGHELQSSTNTNTELIAKLAGDGDPFTYWESVSNKFPQSLSVDLGDKKQLGRIVLKLPPLDAWAARDQSIAVQGSDDGEHYTVIKALDTYTFDPAKENTVEIALDAASARYVKLIVEGNTGWPAAQISEFELYGP
ncbi:discoidin domain-containing protein [Paenibacillus sp. CF384]|uniref:discoidin domain-containing protein n=1 Tax=Paenibacillus sp. CF384 TaxID=1884382 RepID=UPI0008965E64|nr:discoidin domain-containing protein [Paenibacillus sp. CF384]SDX80361.1 F5/8 type C domain-containing protein [Paenibacillus sp. CF384]